MCLIHFYSIYLTDTSYDNLITIAPMYLDEGKLRSYRVKHKNLNHLGYPHGGESGLQSWSPAPPSPSQPTAEISDINIIFISFLLPHCLDLHFFHPYPHPPLHHLHTQLISTAIFNIITNQSCCQDHDHDIAIGVLTGVRQDLVKRLQQLKQVIFLAENLH